MIIFRCGDVGFAFSRPSTHLHELDGLPPPRYTKTPTAPFELKPVSDRDMPFQTVPNSSDPDKINST